MLAKRKPVDKAQRGSHRILSRISCYIEHMLSDDLRRLYGIHRGDSVETQVATAVRVLASSGRKRISANVKENSDEFKGDV